MYVRALGLLLVVALIVHLARRLRPSRFGLVFGLLVLYVPLHLRAPLNVLPMVNALTGFLVLLVLLMPKGSRRLGTRARALRTLAFALVGVSLVGFGLSLGAGEPFGDQLTLFKRWIDPVLFGLLALSLVRDEDRRFVVACMAVGYAIVAVHAVREGFDYGMHKRIPGLLGQVNETAAYLAMYAPILLALAFLITGVTGRALLFTVVLVGAWALVFTESRGGMIGYALGVVGALVVSKRVVIALAGLALSLVVFAVPEILPERVVARFESTVVETPSVTDTGDEMLEPSAAARIQQWTAGLKAMAVNPLGVGFNRYKQTIGGYGGIKGLDAHNFFVLFGVEFGIVGLIVAATLFVRIGSHAWIVARDGRDRFTRVLGVGAFGMLLAAVVVNFFGSRLMQVQPSTCFWVLAAITSRAADSLARRPAAEGLVAAAPAGSWRTP